jgi:hypothetical protein
MTGGEALDGQATLVHWARDARARSAACAAQAQAAAESAAAIGQQVDRIIERVAERNPEHAKRLRAIIGTAVSQRTAIADQRRGPGAGRPAGRPLPRLRNMPAASTDLPGRLPDQFIAHDRAPDGELQDTVIQAIFAAALTLQDAARLTTEPEARWRIDAAVSGLDELIRGIRDALFNSAHR